MYTEAEAKKKWCPFARAAWPHGYDEAGGYQVANREESASAPTPSSCRCIASECMAWRWDEEESNRLNIAWSCREPMKRTPEEHEKIHGPCPAKVGFCGL